MMIFFQEVIQQLSSIICFRIILPVDIVDQTGLFKPTIQSYIFIGMINESYAIDLKQLKIFISQLASCRIDEVLLEDFNNTYELGIDVHSPSSLIIAAEAIENRLKKHYSLNPTVNKQHTGRWHLGEKTVFFCTFIYFMGMKKLSLQSLVACSFIQKEKDLFPLQKIFLEKDTFLLFFEAKHLFCNAPLIKNQWSQECIELFHEIMRSRKEEYQRNQKCFRWKEVSYEIFRQARNGEFHSAKDCRQKWTNHFNPQLVKATWTHKEDIELFTAISEFGCKWSFISRKTGGLRTEHMVKNRTNALLKRYLKKKSRKITSQQITSVFAALKAHQNSEQNSELGLIPSSSIKKEECVFQELQKQIKIEMEEDYNLDPKRQKNEQEFQQNANQLILEIVKQQCLSNEQGYLLNNFETNKQNSLPDLKQQQ